MKRHDSGEGVEDSCDERGAFVEEPACHPPDEPDCRRPERDLDDLRREERTRRERVDRREEIDVERRDEIRHGPRPAEKHVAVRHVRRQPRVDAAVQVPRGLEERVGVEAREDRDLQREGGEEEQEEAAAHAARLARELTFLDGEGGKGETRPCFPHRSQPVARLFLAREARGALPREDVLPRLRARQKVAAEVRMGDADERFRSLADVLAPQVRRPRTR